MTLKMIFFFFEGFQLRCQLLYDTSHRAVIVISAMIAAFVLLSLYVLGCPNVYLIYIEICNRTSSLDVQCWLLIWSHVFTQISGWCAK